MGFPSVMQELRCTEEQAALGISMLCLGFVVVPLTSAFSEEFGRRPLYVICIVVFTATDRTPAVLHSQKYIRMPRL
jgi:predicted MFS family arabinose efflux permease